MNQTNDEKREDSCPLCKTAGEAMNKLGLNVRPKSRNRKSLKWLGIILLTLALALGTFVIYKPLADFFSGAAKTSQENQSGDRLAKPATSPTDVGVQIGAFAPYFASEDIFGNKVVLSDFRNKKPVLLVFWATWCGYCAKELPDLKTFTQRHQNEIQVIAISSGEIKDTVKNYTEEKDINFLILLDETRKIWNQYLVRGTPSHFLIGQDGKVITLRPGLASLNDLEVMMTMAEE